MEFNEKIKTLRMERGLTLEELARRVGVSAPTIQRYESGAIANVRRDKISKLADALNVSPAYLMGWEEPITAPTGVTLAAHRTDGYDTDLPEEAQIELANYVEYLRAKHKKK